MIKRYKLISDGRDYRHQGRLAICDESLSELFNLNNADEIIAVVSSKRPTDDNHYYRVSIRNPIGIIAVYTGYGRKVYDSFHFARNVVKAFGGYCYFWVELP